MRPRPDPPRRRVLLQAGKAADPARQEPVVPTESVPLERNCFPAKAHRRQVRLSSLPARRSVRRLMPRMILWIRADEPGVGAFPQTHCRRRPHPPLDRLAIILNHHPGSLTLPRLSAWAPPSARIQRTMRGMVRRADPVKGEGPGERLIPLSHFGREFGVNSAGRCSPQTGPARRSRVGG